MKNWYFLLELFCMVSNEFFYRDFDRFKLSVIQVFKD